MVDEISKKKKELEALKKERDKKQPKESNAIASIIATSFIVMIITIAIHNYISLPLGLVNTGILLWILLILQLLIAILLCLLTHQSYMYDLVNRQQKKERIDFRIKLLEEEISSLESNAER